LLHLDATDSIGGACRKPRFDVGSPVSNTALAELYESRSSSIGAHTLEGGQAKSEEDRKISLGEKDICSLLVHDGALVQVLEGPFNEWEYPMGYITEK
jgi:hypothetical protein